MTELLATVLEHIDCKSIAKALKGIARLAECEEIALVSSQASKVILLEENNLVSLKEGFDLVAALSLIVWEKLHTGHWKDVADGWRKLFTVLSLVKTILLAKLNVHLASRVRLDKHELERDIVKICDIALLMGMPLLGNACASLAAAISLKCQDRLAVKEEEEGSERERKRRRTEGPLCAGVASPVDRAFEPPLELFVSKYKDKAEPVIMEGLMRDWPATKKWSADYLRSTCGMRTVPVELGTRYTDGDWTQTLMTVQEFIDRYIFNTEAPVKGYLAQHQLLDQIRELKEDILIPDLCYTGVDEDIDINAWFGPPGTVSPLHTDPKHNVLCQVFGSKFIRLYPASQTSFLYPYDDEMLSNTSRIDLDNVDYEAFPKFKEARGLDCWLGPGEMLYIPPKCWHFVTSLSTSFSVSFWFQ